VSKETVQDKNTGRMSLKSNFSFQCWDRYSLLIAQLCGLT